MKKYLGLFLIICLVSLSLPTQVTAGECVSFIEEQEYVSTIHPNNMIAYTIVGYAFFRSNHDNISYYNATIMNASINVQANGSIHIDIYKTYLYDNASCISYEFMEAIDLIAQPVVGFNRSFALPYLNGNVLYDEGLNFWVPSIILLVTNVENYTVHLEMTALTYWDVYFIDDSIPVVTETNTTETTEQAGDETETPTTTTSNITVGNNGISIWTVIIGVVVIAESVMIVVLGHLIRGKWKEMASGRSNYLLGGMIE